MKEYLKMADVFKTGDRGIRFIGIPVSNEAAAIGAHTDYAAHAINSHDELVQMNKELLEALEWSDSQIMEFISVAFRHAEILGDFEISDVRDALNLIKSKAIAKAKGGAA